MKVEKLELKHLAPYLPYGLKFQMQSDSREDFEQMIDDLSEDKEQFFKAGSVWELCGYTGVDIPVCGDGEIDGLIFKHESGMWIGDNKSLKPILHPLSDLTEEQVRLITEYSDIENVFFSRNPSSLYFINTEDKTYLEDYINATIFLFQHHFDVFGLIESGLAVDINTLKHEK